MRGTLTLLISAEGLIQSTSVTDGQRQVATLTCDHRCMQAVSAGVVGALMQMQSISYCGAFRQPAAELLRSLAVQDSAARQQMLSAVVRQPPETTPAEWARWWAELQQDLGLCTPSIDNVQSEMSL